jgi:TPR repeat protein
MMGKSAAMEHGRLWAVCTVLLATAACAQIQQAAEDASRHLDRLFGVDKSAEPAPAPVSEADRLYQAGLAADRDGQHKSAVARFEKAAERGHAGASYELGVAYNEGRGVGQDLEAAAKWFNLAAERGDPRAQYLVGTAYYFGQGVPQDRERAVEALAKAAVQGHADAQFLLAKAFGDGQGVPKDPAWAARWYAKAARQGQSDAFYAYGVVLSAGLGVPKDPVAGYAWILIAARDGHGKAAKLRPSLAKGLSSEQRAAAEAQVEAFKPRPTNRFEDPPTVTYLQVTLNRLGYPAGDADGRLGPNTRAAIRAYQKKAGLWADGALTPKLLERLLVDSR